MSIEAMKIKLAGIHRKVILERLAELPEDIRRILEGTAKDRDLVLTPDNIMAIIFAIDTELSLNAQSVDYRPLIEAKEKLLSAATQASTAMELSASLEKPAQIYGAMGGALKNRIERIMEEYSLR